MVTMEVNNTTYQLVYPSIQPLLLTFTMYPTPYYLTQVFTHNHSWWTWAQLTWPLNAYIHLCAQYIWHHQTHPLTEFVLVHLNDLPGLSQPDPVISLSGDPISQSQPAIQPNGCRPPDKPTIPNTTNIAGSPTTGESLPGSGGNDINSVILTDEHKNSFPAF